MFTLILTSFKCHCYCVIFDSAQRLAGAKRRASCFNHKGEKDILDTHFTQEPLLSRHQSWNKLCHHPPHGPCSSKI